MSIGAAAEGAEVAAAVAGMIAAGKIPAAPAENKSEEIQ